MDIAVSTLANGLQAAAPVQAPLAADPLATERFAELMGGTQPTAPAALNESAAALALPPPQDRTMGDSILASMQSVSSGFKQSMGMVQAALDSGQAMTMSDMLRVQMGLAQVSVQYELVGKAVSRAAQNLDQLVKLQ